MCSLLSLETGSYQSVSWFLPVVSAALLLELTTLDSKMHPTANRAPKKYSSAYIHIKGSAFLKRL